MVEVLLASGGVVGGIVLGSALVVFVGDPAKAAFVQLRDFLVRKRPEPSNQEEAVLSSTATGKLQRLNKLEADRARLDVDRARLEVDIDEINADIELTQTILGSPQAAEDKTS